MAWLLAHLHWFGLTLVGANALIVCSAALEAGRLKSNGEAPKAPDNFLVPMMDPVGVRFLTDLYHTDTRRLYPGHWIHALVLTARVTMPLSSAAIVLMIGLSFSGATG